ncbi:MAG TPA: FlgD immunoglobulin-like domain containing protein [Candidatus Eisenbacteria bacterium]
MSLRSRTPAGSDREVARRAPLRTGRLIAFALAASSWAWVPAAHAAPTLGFVENWPGTSPSTWGGGSVITNPGTGGTLGAGDGFLLVSTATPANLGANSAGPEYAGDWVAAGITQVRVWLNDVNAPDPLEIHFVVGRRAGTLGLTDPGNVWEFNTGFLPANQVWKEFVVDLSTSVGWTQIIGSGTFTNALQTLNRVHLRHDHAPFTQTPDAIAADFGIDHLLLTNGVVAVDPQAHPGVTRAVELAPPAPNPSRGAVTLAVESFDSGPVSLQIVDAAGRVLRRAELPAGAPGARRWTWDGADDRGRAVAPGVYRVRAWGAAGGTSRPLVRVR